MESNRLHKPQPTTLTGNSMRFRRLEPHELVKVGDYIASDRKELELWEGLKGFRADAFLKQIYRQDKSRSTASKK